MLSEALASPEVAATQLADVTRLVPLARALSDLGPGVALTVARGSSDHAASYFATLAMMQLGLPVASLPMSVATLQEAPLRVQGQMAIAFSQSGRSPDLVNTMEVLRDKGALTVSAVNTPASPLAQACEWNLPLHAGPERSVAATKSYIAMLTLSAQLIAMWKQDSHFMRALAQLPADLDVAAALDWQCAVEEFKDVERMLVIGRGLGLAVAQEAALKLKETSGIQAEAFSSAEVRHGPMELIGRDYPLLVFAPRGPEQTGLVELAWEMRQRGARVLLAAPADVGEASLPLHKTAHPSLDPIAAILSFYVMAAALSTARNRNPDAPEHLSKVTETH